MINNTNYDEQNNTQEAGNKTENFITSFIDSIVEPIMESFKSNPTTPKANNKAKPKPWYSTTLFKVVIALVAVILAGIGLLFAHKYKLITLPGVALPAVPTYFQQGGISGLTTINDITVTPQA